jgi:hypothetical protein
VVDGVGQFEQGLVSGAAPMQVKPIRRHAFDVASMFEAGKFMLCFVFFLAAFGLSFYFGLQR